jgi:hypothetical protein
MENEQTQNQAVIGAGILANITLQDFLLAAQKLSNNIPAVDKGISWQDFRLKYMNFIEAERKHSTMVHNRLAFAYLEKLKHV